MRRAAIFSIAIVGLQAWARADVAPTFSRDIAPLLRAKCGGCHVPGGLAPFSLVNHADARLRAGKIARIALDGLMPPWLPAHGGFADDRRLNGAEVALLRRWAEAGAREGETAKPWKAPDDPWMLGTPDLVFTMPRFHTVPANAELQTVHFVFPEPFKTTRYLRAVEAIPGNRGIVLQVNAIFDRSGRARELGGETGSYERFGGSGFFPVGFVQVYSPGRGPAVIGGGVPMKLTADTDLVLQVRYRPSRDQQMDVTRIGLYFAETGVERNPSSVFLGNEDLRIAAGASEEVIRDRVVLAAPIEVQEIRPKLLRFGRAIQAWADPPAGKRIPLLDIQDWDLTWMETYRLAKPITLPKGTAIIAEWTVSNPTEREVRAGDTLHDEAPALWLGGLTANWADHITLTGANLLHYTNLMDAARQGR